MTVDPDAVGGRVSVRVGAWRGLRDERAPADAIEDAVARFERGEARPLKQDARSHVAATRAGALAVVVKEVRKGGWRRRLADRFRGSPAARAFRGGRALVAAGIGAALPLAALEQRRLGVPVRSLLVSLDLRADPTVARCLEEGRPDRAELLAALADLLVALHRAGARHGDLRTQHLFAGRAADGALRLRLVDLESLRLAGPPADEARMEDWAQMLGSIPAAHATRDERRAAFERYARALPFPGDAQDAFEAVDARSLRRGHLYRREQEPLSDSGPA